MVENQRSDILSQERKLSGFSLFFHSATLHFKKREKLNLSHLLIELTLASRGRDKKTKKDIQTNDFVKKFMEENNIVSLDFYVAYTKDGIPPTYLETILLYEYFKEKKCLPKLNNSF